jgi:NTE family protein
MKKFGLALSGGGIRGVAHLGVIKAMEECGIKPSVISGTSAGAIVGALYASGLSPQQILDIVIKEKFFSYRSILFRKAGIFDMNMFERVYAKHIGTDSFESLSIPLFVATTDIVKCESVIFSSGPLFKALLASSCVPLIFQPVHFADRILLDGGITDNFPVETIKPLCDVMIGVHVNSLTMDVTQIHMKDTLDRSFHLVLSGTIAEKAKHCNIFIEPENMSRFGMFDFNKVNEIFEVGYQKAKEQLNEQGYKTV